MKAYDLVELAGRNLREAMLRNSLTTLGISVGVASLVAMLSLGAGLQKLAGRQLGRSGLFDTIIVSSRQDFRSQEDRAEDKNSQSADFRVLDDTARNEIAKLPNVTEVYPDIRLMAELRYLGDTADSKLHYAAIASLPMSGSASESIDELQGKYFSTGNAEECIILSDFGRELLGLPIARATDKQKLTKEQVNQLLGKDITLRYAERQANATTAENKATETKQATADTSASNPLTALGGGTDFSVVRKERTLKIVGMVETEPYGGMRGGARAKLFMPTPLAESLNMIQPADLRTLLRPGKGKSYLSLVVRMKGSRDVKTAQEAIKKMGFSTFSILDASKGLNKFFIFLDLFLAIFGSLALAVASLGIVNTLVMAILERRREIGIMKALGASDIDVKKLFFVEAGAMGALGGVLGIVLGWAIGRIINFGTNIYLVKQDITPENFWFVPWWLVSGALAFAVVVSLIAGLYPASRAARLDPVQALRHD